ncbi:MAG: peptidylprolyl isomerase [Acidimicrobiales bacterium]
MRRLSLCLAALGAGVALAASACGSVSSYAATVDGTRISRGSLNGELRDIAANDKYLKFVESQVQVRTNGVFDAAFTASVLSRQIIYTLVDRDLRSRKIALSATDLAAARASAGDRVGGEDIFTAFSKSYQDTLVKRSAEVNVLSFALAGQGSPEQASRAYYDAHKDDFAKVCVSHILLPSADAANAAKARLDAGEAFADVAKAVSTDSGSAPKGGVLGCYSHDNQLVPEFAQAMFSQPVGQVGAPVQTQFGFHLILVTSREVPPYEQVSAQAREAAATAAQDKLQAWVADVVNKAKISVNPQYGHFDKNGADSRVVPPEAPTTTAPATSVAPAAPGP